MPLLSPVRELVNEPVPEPSVVWLLAVVGVPPVFQQTPRAVTGSEPMSVTLPPELALPAVTALAAVVVTVGAAAAAVVKVSSLP